MIGAHQGKLPVWTTVLSAYRTMWAHKRALLRLALVPLGLYVLISHALFILREALPDTAEEMIDQITIFAPVIPFAAFFVDCTRLFQAGGAAVGRDWRLPLSPSALKLLGRLWPNPFHWPALVVLAFFGAYLGAKWGVLYVWPPFWHPIITALPMPEVLFQLAFQATALVIFYVALRLSLAPLSAALGQDWSLAGAWNRSSGHGLRLLAAGLITFLPFMLLLQIAIWAYLSLLHSPPRTLYFLIGGLNWLFSTIIWAAVTWNAHRILDPEMAAPEA